MKYYYPSRNLEDREYVLSGGDFTLYGEETFDTEFTKIMKGVFDACSKHGYTVLLGSSELLPDQEIKNIETLVNKRVDGLIISPLQGDDVDLTHIADLIKMKYPMVMLDSLVNFSTNTVEINNVEASYQAVSYLIELGHKNIAYFAGSSYSKDSYERMNGYQKALISFNVPIHADNIIQVGSYIKDGYYRGRELFLKFDNNSPTAVFCFNDLVAIGLINSLLELGIKVPEQVSVIGFDDINF